MGYKIVIPVIAIVSVLVASGITLDSFAHLHGAFDENSDLPELKDWMKTIPDETKITELSLPGTHDSMSYGGFDLEDRNPLITHMKTLIAPESFPFSSFTFTQTMGMSQQLEGGIRALDMRVMYMQHKTGDFPCGSGDSCYFRMYHGFIDMNNRSFGEEMDKIEKFLQNNPSETIIMNLQYEKPPCILGRFCDKGAGYTGAMKKFLDNYSSFILPRSCVSAAAITGDAELGIELGPINSNNPCHARGKLIIVVDNWFDNSGDLISKETGKYFIGIRNALAKERQQNDFQIDFGESVYFDKWRKVEDHMIESKQTPFDDKLWVNFLTATGEFKFEGNTISWVKAFPYRVAGGHFLLGPRISTDIQAVENPNTLHDYPRLAWELCDLLFETIRWETPSPCLGMLPPPNPPPGLQFGVTVCCDIFEEGINIMTDNCLTGTPIDDFFVLRELVGLRYVCSNHEKQSVGRLGIMFTDFIGFALRDSIIDSNLWLLQDAGSYDAFEGTKIRLSGCARDTEWPANTGCSTDSANYMWAFHGEFTFLSAVGKNPLYETGDGDGVENIHMKVPTLDPPVVVKGTVEVSNVAPTVSIPVEPVFNSFQITIPIYAADPSVLDVQSGFAYIIDWGDGTEDDFNAGQSLSKSHIYQSGQYTIKVEATDKDTDTSKPAEIIVKTPFHGLSDEFEDLFNKGIINKGQANSFISKVNQVIASFEKGNSIPACNKAEAIINELSGYINGGILTPSVGQDLIDKVQKEIDKAGCNSENILIPFPRSAIAVENRFVFGQTTMRQDFSGDVAGSIVHGEQIIAIVPPGQFTSTEEEVDWSTVTEIICSDDNSTGNLATRTATFNVEENEYVTCIFYNLTTGFPGPFLSFTERGSVSTSSDTATAEARFNTNTSNSNPSSAQPSDNVTDDKKGGGGDEHLTRPTFGVSHETFETIVDSGFRFNDQSFTINDNFHTSFAQQTVNIGEVNTFEAKIYADKRLKVQEFLFGIPNVGEAHLAELGVEVWYDYNGEIEEVKAVQKSNVIDKETIVATHEKTKCQATDSEEKCDTTNVSMVFLEPLQDKVMAVKAIDYKGRYQITYLNEGVEIAGESLNPMQTYLIPSNVRDGGLIKVTQLAKYSPYWQSDDDRMFEMNSFGSFKETNITFERFQDTGTAYTRLHSGFGGVMAYELKRATGIFDASELISELPDFIPYTPPEISERMTDEMKQKMFEQEEIAKKILEESKVQARW